MTGRAAAVFATGGPVLADLTPVRPADGGGAGLSADVVRTNLVSRAAAVFATGGPIFPPFTAVLSADGAGRVAEAAVTGTITAQLRTVAAPVPAVDRTLPAITRADGAGFLAVAFSVSAGGTIERASVFLADLAREAAAIARAVAAILSRLTPVHAAGGDIRNTTVRFGIAARVRVRAAARLTAVVGTGEGARRWWTINEAILCCFSRRFAGTIAVAFRGQAARAAAD
ncbi:MAG: hypothetical protein WCS85_00035 [Candidatus Peribacteraceae bacterium]